MDWTFVQFATVLLQTILIYMVAGLVFPDLFGEQVVDLKENFYAHRGWFFSLAVAMIAVSICKNVALEGTLPHPRNLTFHGIFGVTLLFGAFTRRESYHKILIMFGIAAFVLYVAMLFAHLR